MKFLLLALLAVAASCGVSPPEVAVRPPDVAVAPSDAAATPLQKGVLYKKNSPYSTVIVTEDNHGLRTLWFEEGGARQSVVKVGDPDHLELPYAHVMPVGLAVVDQPHRVLIVGLGGGTIPSFLHHHFPKMTIDVVDIDPDVVHVAKKYFGFKEDDTMHAFVDDGRRFIENSRGRYDIIFLDAFGADSVPYHLSTREFLQSTREALTPRGIVVANIWSRRTNVLHDSMLLTYLDVFDQLYMLEVRGAGNEILLAVPRAGKIDRDTLARRASEMSRQHRFRFDMGERVTYGFRLVTKEGLDGVILLDKAQP
jgi:spermidine synthase